MRNEDTNEAPRCPICNAEAFWECGHLVADFDITFNECSGGALHDIFDEFVSLLEELVVKKIRNFPLPAFDTYKYHLDELIELAVDECDADEENVDVIGFAFFELIAEVLQDCGAEEYSGPLILDGGPGQSSANRLFFGAMPKEIVTSAFARLKKESAS